MDAYLLRNIPDDLWHRVKVRATTQKKSVRDVIIAALERYAGDEKTTTTRKALAAR